MNSEESTSNNVLGTKVYISVMTTCSSLRCIFGCMNRIKGKLKLDGLTAPVKFCVEKIGRYQSVSIMQWDLKLDIIAD